MHSTDWNDLRVILLVAEEGSAAAAGRRLGLNHTTILRRIGAFEEIHNVRLFDRRTNGYQLSREGSELVDSLRTVREAVTGFERKLKGQEKGHVGHLRVTTTDSLAGSILVDPLAEFCAKYPEITVDVSMNNDRYDLSRRDADIAIRPSRTPPEHLIGRRVSELAFAAYAIPEIADEFDKEFLTDFRWIGFAELLANAPPAKWLTNTICSSQIQIKADSFLVMQKAAEKGLGIAILPCCLGVTSSQLKRLTLDLEPLTTELWILTHEDLHHAVPVKVFMEFMSSKLVYLQPVLTGTAPKTETLDDEEVSSMQ